MARQAICAIAADFEFIGSNKPDLTEMIPTQTNFRAGDSFIK
jgi:hypothetical protein